MADSFPQFRKNITGTSYYQISSEHQLIEWQRLGHRLLRHEMNATILPERLLIEDLLNCNEGHYERISKEEFNSATNQE
jgi:hypothetical protein